mgnify:CR=1 FL=1
MGKIKNWFKRNALSIFLILVLAGMFYYHFFHTYNPSMFVEFVLQAEQGHTWKYEQ